MQLRGENVNFGTCAVEAGLVDLKGAPNAFLTVQGGNFNGVDDLRDRTTPAAAAASSSNDVDLKGVDERSIPRSCAAAPVREVPDQHARGARLRQPGQPERFVCTDCNIGVLSSSGSTNAAARIEGGQVDDLGTGLGYLLELAGNVARRCTVRRLNGAVLKTNDDAHIVGNLTITESGSSPASTIVEGNLTGTNRPSSAPTS
jgi:hypothetical protein